jgi:inner membrane transporter RhtA
MRHLLVERGDDEHAPDRRKHDGRLVGVARLRSLRTAAVPAPLLVVAGIASVQSGAAIATHLFASVGPGGTVWLRLGLSALLLLAVARPRFVRRSRRDALTVVAFGVVLAAMNATFYESLSRIPLGVAVTVEFVGPLVVAVSGSRKPADFVWVALAAVGVVLLTSGGGRLDGLGLALAFIAGCFWGAYILVAQRVGAVFPGATGLALALSVGAVALAPFGIVAGGSTLLHPGVLGRGAAVALLSSALPYSFELMALRRIRASVFGVLMSLEPAVAALSGLVFLGQDLRAREWLAIAAVMLASIGATRGARPPDQPIEPGATPTTVPA